jgi:hypothetical protein
MWLLGMVAAAIEDLGIPVALRGNLTEKRRKTAMLY